MTTFESFHWFTSGALAMILGFILFQLMNIYRLELIYIALYLVSVLAATSGGYYLSTQPESEMNDVLLGLCQTSVHIASFIFSFLFMRQLLDLHKRNPVLNKAVNFVISGLTVYLAADVILCIFFSELNERYVMYHALRVLLILFTLVSVVILFRNGDLTTKYFLYGVVSYILMGSIATVYQILASYPESDNTIPTYAYRTGVLIQILFFVNGISNKLKVTLREQSAVKQKLEAEVQQKEFEKKEAILLERIRISQDMHDDLGSGIAKISLLSEMLKQHNTDNDNSSPLEKISASAKEVLENISEIVWSLNPRNDSLQNLAYYLRKHTVEFLEPSNMKCTVHMASDIPAVSLSSEVRRNVFLSVKESLHNIVKHSGASEVDISFKTSDKIFEIIIHDDGKGIDLKNKNVWGNGLTSMRNRITSIGGIFRLENHIGTTVRIQFPIDTTQKGY